MGEDGAVEGVGPPNKGQGLLGNNTDPVRDCKIKIKIKTRLMGEFFSTPTS